MGLTSNAARRGEIGTLRSPSGYSLPILRPIAPPHRSKARFGIGTPRDRRKPRAGAFEPGAARPPMCHHGDIVIECREPPTKKPGVSGRLLNLPPQALGVGRNV